MEIAAGQELTRGINVVRMRGGDLNRVRAASRRWDVPRLPGADRGPQRSSEEECRTLDIASSAGSATRASRQAAIRITGDCQEKLGAFQIGRASCREGV